MSANGNIAINGTVVNKRRVEFSGSLDPDTSCSVVESVSAVKESTYPRDTDVAYLLGLLRNYRSTGTLRVDISQGGVCSIRFEERQKLP